MKKLSLVLTMVLFVVGFAVAQRTITGTVSDGKGEPMVGASVLVKGTTTGAVTDIDGKFSVSVPANATTLVFSFAGYKSQEITLGASNVIDVNLAEAQLQEVVVTAIGIQREKKALGYSATDLKSDDIAQKSESDPVRALTSKVPGVNIVGGGGAPGQSTKINIRGYSSLTGNTQPLFVVDGIPFDNSVNASSTSNGGTQFSNRAFDIDPNNIESMTILKGAAAAALYGSRATNGVVVITTKTGKKNRKGLEVTFNSSSSVEQVSNLPNYQNVYTQGSNQNYSGAFIGNWGAPFPDQVDRINNEFFGGTARYSVNGYASGYTNGTAPHPIVASGYYGETRFRTAFPELLTTVNGSTNGIPINLKPYDFMKDFFQKGMLTENALTFNSGGENMGLSATISRMDNRGILPMYEPSKLGSASDTPNDWGSENWTQAKSSRTSLSFGGNAKLNNGLLITGGVTYVNTNQVTPPVAPSYFSDYGTIGDATIFSRLFYLPRNYDLIGYPFEHPVTRDNVFYRALDNPIWLAKYSRYESNVNRAYGNLTLSYDVTPWLNLMAKGGVNTYSDVRKNQIRSGGVFDPNGRIWTDDLTNTEIDMNYIATISKKLTSDLDMRVILGVNANQRSFSRKFIDADGIITGSLMNVDATTTQIVSGGPSGILSRKQRLYAGYGDLQLSYKNFLYLGIVARNDWTSTLLRPDGTGNNSYFYPGVNMSFAFTDAFKMNSNILSFGKIRAAYTQVGNEATPYRTATTYFFNTPFITSSGSRVNRATYGNRLGNPNLRNELTTELEFGTDLRFFRNRVGVDLTWFKRNSVDQITSADLPASTGFATQIINAGNIENKGIELGVDLTPIKTSSGFTWNAFVNFTRIRSKIVNLGEGADAPNEIVLGVPGTSFGTIYRVGLPYGQIFGTKLARADDGSMLIEKGSGLTSWLPDNEVIGNPNPDFTLGWRNTLSYKGFGISWLFDWKQGGDIFSITAASLMLRGQLAFSSDREAMRVIPGYYADPDDPTKPLLVDGKPVKNTTPITAFESHFSNGFGAYGADEVNIYDGTTFRLREVAVTYEFPKTLLKKTPFGAARLSVSGRNLWFKAPNMLKDLNLDPEVLAETAESNVQGFEVGATPTTRRYGLNLYLTF
ncbi:MAG: SusC/RagA family TonB-linked outer membrane protein [Saprospiraceae bacterium]|nr:SusC/RagA family TonB-linked outer membrane protein [Saprospiraceae bacterium]